MLFGVGSRIRKLQMKGDLILHITRISEERMQECGVVALSRGNTAKGVMIRKQLLGYLPLHLSALDRSKKLMKWVKSWWLENEPLVYLSPEGYFVEVFLKGFFYGSNHL